MAGRRKRALKYLARDRRAPNDDLVTSLGPEEIQDIQVLSEMGNQNPGRDVQMGGGQMPPQGQMGGPQGGMPMGGGQMPPQGQMGGPATGNGMFMPSSGGAGGSMPPSGDPRYNNPQRPGYGESGIQTCYQDGDCNNGMRCCEVPGTRGSVCMRPVS